MTIKIKIKKIRSPSPRPSPHSMGRGAFFFWALMRNPVGVFGRRDGVAHSENGMYGFYGFWGRVPAGVSLDGRKPVLTRINPDGNEGNRDLERTFHEDSDPFSFSCRFRHRVGNPACRCLRRNGDNGPLRRSRGHGDWKTIENLRCSRRKMKHFNSAL